jgi:hypothetical protein
MDGTFNWATGCWTVAAIHGDALAQHRFPF